MSDIITTHNEEALRASLETNLIAFFSAVKLPEAMGAMYHSPEFVQSVTNVPMALFNSVVGAKLADTDIDAAIETVIGRCREKNVPLLWWVGPETQPADLRQRLEAHGLQLSSDIPGMILDLAKLEGAEPLPDGVAIEEVNDLEAMPIWSHTLVLGFGMSEELADPMNVWMSSTFEPDVTKRTARHYIAYVNGEPAGTATVFMGGGVAGIYNITTLETFRRRGIGRAITLRPLLDAKAQGYRFSMLHSSVMGKPVYEKLGYETLDTISQYYWSPQ